MKEQLIIGIVGLGYVGIPLAVSFSKKYKVIGFDYNKNKIERYKNGIDVTNEVGDDEIKASSIDFTSDESKLKECDRIIVAVPTPVDENYNPDLYPLQSASEIVGKNLKKETNKASLLLGFRRFIEMLLRVDTILAVENIYDKKNFAISSENIIFYLDRRYYSDFKVISFMDIFKIETSNYKRLYWYNENLPPHLGLILKYVESHYNTTYRFFTNRNLEYHCIYTILYQLNSEIKEIINILNSYHYLTDEESLKLYNISFEEVYKKIDFVLEKIEKFLSLVL